MGNYQSKLLSTPYDRDQQRIAPCVTASSPSRHYEMVVDGALFSGAVGFRFSLKNPNCETQITNFPSIQQFIHCKQFCVQPF